MSGQLEGKYIIMKKNIKRMLKYTKKTYPLVKPYMNWNVRAIIFEFLATILQLLFPLCIQYLIDDIAMVGKWEHVIRFFILISSIVLGKQIFGYLSCVLYAELSTTVAMESSKKIFSKVLKNKLDFFYHNSDGEIITRITEDSNYISVLLSYTIVHLVKYVTQIIVVFGILFYMSPWLALGITMTVPIYVFLNEKYGGVLERYSEDYRNCLTKQTEFFIENIKNIKYIKNFVLENEVEKENIHINQEKQEIALKVEKTGYRFSNLMRVCVDLNKVIVLVIGGIFVSKGTLTIGALVAFMNYMDYVYSPFISLPNLYKQLLMILVSLERYFEYIEDEQSTEERNEFGEIVKEINEIKFEHVNFHYENQNDNILQSVNLQIKKGDKICIEGKSGQGKSTLMSLLKCFYAVNDGKIFLNGKDIFEYSVESVRKAMFYLPQEVIFYNKSVRENFQMIKPNISDNQIIKCLVKAKIYDELFCERHEGLNTILSKNGTNLSGGQRQRLLIAFLFAVDSDMIVLDEPFTGIDNNTVIALWEEMKVHLMNKTVILIDHNFIDTEYFTKFIRIEDAMIY